jgi:hypothetical protein
MDDPLRPHSHISNPYPPTADPTFTLRLPDGRTESITIRELKKLPVTAVANCLIVTDHGTNGPFTFAGVALLDLLRRYLGDDVAWETVELISADQFGTRLTAAELHNPSPAGPPLLSYAVDGRDLARQEGLVRLVVPSEQDNALRQVKWIDAIRIIAPTS